ncbi:VOC family protein [Lacticaseibacillus baoqingensis]|uniref:VOC family protein n=1 Tax=Lacticaseibacillus baoqingensis TaxID=2486013 RepID=A0ABW4E863_9LACO|nr:VOC family protein [Lacticaseibacillus baoqingensis]
MITHIGVWVQDLTACKAFYETYFAAHANTLYTNPQKQFSSYFLSFPNSAVRLELMHQPELAPAKVSLGFAHVAFSLGSERAVAALTKRLAQAGYHTTAPRRTGDGYFEATVEDPEGNLLELTV